MYGNSRFASMPTHLLQTEEDYTIARFYDYQPSHQSESGITLCLPMNQRLPRGVWKLWSFPSCQGRIYLACVYLASGNTAISDLQYDDMIGSAQTSGNGGAVDAPDPAFSRAGAFTFSDFITVYKATTPLLTHSNSSNPNNQRL